MKKLRAAFWTRLHKPLPCRLKSKQEISGEEERNVVKGTAKRVIVVKSPDPAVFEEAIFVVRDDYMRRGGMTQKELMRQARSAAKSYTASVATKRRFAFRSPAPFIAATCAALSGLAYVVLRMAGIY